MSARPADSSVGLPDAFTATRDSLHRLAEHVLAAALFQSTGRIGLRVTAGGFGTPRFVHDGLERQVRIEGAELVVVDGATRRTIEVHSIAQAAEFVGIAAGGPAAVYALVTPLEPDAELTIDATSAAVTYEWLSLAADALERFRTSHADLEPSTAQLWPEHFDLAISVAEVNYGGSLGDAQHHAPYAYVGPWQPDAVTGEFWNASFGAIRSHADCPSADAMVDFFETGRELVNESGAG